MTWGEASAGGGGVTMGHISAPRRLAHISYLVINVEEMLAGKTRPVMAVRRANGRNFPRPRPGDLASYRSLSDRISYFIFSMTLPFVELTQVVLLLRQREFDFYFCICPTLSIFHAERGLNKFITRAHMLSTDGLQSA